MIVMEFIPLKKGIAKRNKSEALKKDLKLKKLKTDNKAEKKPVKKGKLKPKVIEKKVNIKQNKVLKKKGIGKSGKKKKKEKIEMDLREGEEEEKMDECDNENNEGEDEDMEKNEEDSFKKKCKKMDEQKKNRLFVKLKKKILNEGQITELHPDIRKVIFPRKKHSRWCWAVFASEEKANEAMKALIKNKDVLVDKPTPHEKVEKKRKEKMKKVLRKKEATKKLQAAWSL